MALILSDRFLYVSCVFLQAILVFVLYVRCTAINPADPRIMSIFDTGVNGDGMVRGLSRNYDETGSQLQASPSVVSRSSTVAGNSSVKGSVEDAQRVESVSRRSCYNPLAVFCYVFVVEDCRKKEGPAEEQGNSEEALFCTLCNCEVLSFRILHQVSMVIFVMCMVFNMKSK